MKLEFNAREYSFFLTTIFGNPRCGLKKKKKSLKTTLHVHRAFLYISLSSLRDYDMKVHFGGGRKHNTATFVVFSRTSIQSLDEVNEMKKAR